MLGCIVTFIFEVRANGVGLGGVILALAPEDDQTRVVLKVRQSTHQVAVPLPLGNLGRASGARRCLGGLQQVLAMLQCQSLPSLVQCRELFQQVLATAQAYGP